MTAKNYRKRTWHGSVTAVYAEPIGSGRLWLHVDLPQEPDRPVSVVADRAVVQDMILSAVMNDGPSRVGVFSGHLSDRERVLKLRILAHLGVAPELARDLCGFTPSEDRA